MYALTENAGLLHRYAVAFSNSSAVHQPDKEQARTEDLVNGYEQSAPQSCDARLESAPDDLPGSMTGPAHSHKSRYSRPAAWHIA